MCGNLSSISVKLRCISAKKVTKCLFYICNNSLNAVYILPYLHIHPPISLLSYRSSCLPTYRIVNFSADILSQLPDFIHVSKVKMSTRRVETHFLWHEYIAFLLNSQGKLLPWASFRMNHRYFIYFAKTLEYCWDNAIHYLEGHEVIWVYFSFILRKARKADSTHYSVEFHSFSLRDFLLVTYQQFW